MIIGGDVIPAQRPRIEDGKARYPENYEQWRKSAKQALQAAIAALPAMITRHFPLTKVRIAIEFHGCLRGSADLDNSEKGWIDAMVKAAILQGDNVLKVNEIGSKFFPAENPVSAIIIYPDWTPVSVLDPKLLLKPASKTNKLVKTARTAVKRSPAAAKTATKTKLTIVKTPPK